MHLETWEHEVAVRHRWGQHGPEAVQQQLTRLQELWGAAQPFPPGALKLIEHIRALEICNWNLEESIFCLCRANEPAQIPIGHLASITDARWREVWAYYFALCDWLPGAGGRGYPALLPHCDPDGETRSRVHAMRGADGLERADILAACLDPVKAWLERDTDTPPLGKPDPAKRFLAALLVSILRAQELAARKRAEGRLAGQRP